MQNPERVAKRRSQKMLSKQSTSKTKGDAAFAAVERLTQAREKPEEARCLYEQSCDEASAAGTMFNDTIQGHP